MNHTHSAATSAAFDLLRVKSFLERCHWNKARRLGRTRDPEERYWLAHSSLMLSTIGAYLENMADIARDGSIAVDPRETEARISRECRMAAQAFASLDIHPAWHPQGDPGRDFEDEGVRRQWKALCEEVARHAGTEPDYGRLAPPAPIDPRGLGQGFTMALSRIRGPLGIKVHITDEQAHEIWAVAREE